MRRKPWRALGIAALVVAVATPASVRAQSARADSTDLAGQKWGEANTAFQAERYSTAARLFEEAYRLAPRPGILFNAAAAWDLGEELARAATRYREALDLADLDPESKQQATIRLNALRPKLARVEIKEPEGALVTVDHVQRAPVPTRFFLRPGRYVLDAEFDGRTFQRRASFREGQSRVLSLNLPVSEPTGPPPPNPAPGIREPTESTTGSIETVGWLAVTGGVLLGGTAIYLGTRFLAAKSDFLDNQSSASARERAASFRTWTNVAWAGAAVSGGTGLVLLLASPSFEF